MRWVELLPAIVGLFYLAAACGYYAHGSRGFALAYAAYAVANVGLILAAIEGRS